jgi:hypothetical protein
MPGGTKRLKIRTVMSHIVKARQRSVPVAPPVRARSYAVLWREGAGSIQAGKLELGPRSLILENGKARSRLSIRSLVYRDLAGVRTTRDPRERIRDQPTIVLERCGGATIALAAIEPLVSVHEIAEVLADAAAA